MHITHGKQIQYASLMETDCDPKVEVIAAEADKCIVITDIFLSAKQNAINAEIYLYDGNTKFFNWFPEYTSSALNFTGPLYLSSGSSFNVGCDSSATDFSMLITYYYI
jgi:hypothetical protein